MLAVGLVGLSSLILIPLDEGLIHATHGFLHDVNARIPLQATIRQTRHFGTVIGAVAIVVAVALLDRRRAWAAPLLVAAWLAAALSLQIVKEFAGRVRPVYALELIETQRFGFVTPEGIPISGKGDQWIPLWAEGHAFMHTALRSFPSGHAANAFALSAVLAALYNKRWRPFIYALAIMCVLDRLYRFQHYWSDVIFAAAWGWMTAGLVLRTRIAQGAASSPSD